MFLQDLVRHFAENTNSFTLLSVSLIRNVSVPAMYMTRPSNCVPIASSEVLKPPHRDRHSSDERMELVFIVDRADRQMRHKSQVADRLQRDLWAGVFQVVQFARPWYLQASLPGRRIFPQPFAESRCILFVSTSGNK